MLVRTLWSNRADQPGAHVTQWDGVDDWGKPSAGGKFLIRLLQSAVSYSWGIIGDTSKDWTSNNSWDGQATFPVDATSLRGIIYTANGYAEGRPNASSFKVADPQAPTALFTLGQHVQLAFATSDDRLVYFSSIGNDWNNSVPFTMAYDPVNNEPYPFPSTTVNSTATNVPPGVIDVGARGVIGSGRDRNNIPTGLAVQRNGNILAVSHGSYRLDGKRYSPGADSISLFDKTTGAAIGEVPLLDPQRLSFRNDNDLWVISGKTVVRLTNESGSYHITAQLAGVVAPLALSVDPTSQDLLVVDGGSSQQVKRFDFNGVLLSSCGALGGYTDCNSSVTPDRLFVDSTAGFGVGNNLPLPGTWLTSLDDGSYWFGDLGNSRALHVAANGRYLDQFAFITDVYHVTVDHANPTRVFADFLEYKVDYSKPLVPGNPEPAVGGNGGWTLARNWSACLPSRYNTGGFARVLTLPSGRTYGEIGNSDTHNWLFGGPSLELVELVSNSSVAPSGVIMEAASGYHTFLDDDGNMAYWTLTSSPSLTTQTAYRRTLVSDPRTGVPSWSPASVMGSASAETDASGASNSPLGFGGWGMSTFPKASTGGILVTFSSVPGITPTGDLHVGGIALGQAAWRWQTSRGQNLRTPDGQGTFPDLNSFGGHNGIAALVEASNVFEGYDGQWGTFSSQFMHWSDDGLLIGQFGHPANGLGPGNTLWAGAAGNIGSMATATVGKSIYLYNSDEAEHPGVHQWTVKGLDSVVELSGLSQLGGVVQLQ